MPLTTSKTISMHEIRYLNLFQQVTHIHARYCFEYNQTLIFVAPSKLASKAIGEGGVNVRKMSSILGKKVKVVAGDISKNSGVEDVKKFIIQIVHPFTFQDLMIGEQEVILTAGARNKATLIGRNKHRLLELQHIVKEYLNKNLRIV